MMKQVSVVSMALLAAAMGCGDSGPSGNECGEGTVEQDGVCVAVCGEGTVQAGGACVPEDLMTPGRVSGLTATVAGGDIELAWTKGAGATHTTIVRLTDDTGELQLGRTYAVGDVIDGVGTVIAVTDGETFTDPAAPGVSAYAAFAHTGTAYAAPTYASATVPLGAMSATFTFGAGLTVAATGPVTITVAAVPESTVEFDLSITNTTRGPLRNLAMRIETETGVALDGVTDQAFDGLYDTVETTHDRIERSEGTFISLVPGYMNPGETVVRRLSVSPNGGGDPVGTATVTLGQSAGAVSAHAVMDLATGNVQVMPRGVGSKPIALSTGIEWNGAILAGTRQRGELRTFDPATGRIDIVATLRSGNASVPCLAQHAGSLWAISKVGHAGSEAIGVRLHELDPVTLAEVDVTELPDISFDRNGRCLFNGNYLQLTQRLPNGGVRLDDILDLTTGQLVDADTVAPGHQSFVSDDRYANRLVDDGWLYIYNRSTRVLSRENLTTRVVEPLHTFVSNELRHGPFKMGARFVLTGQNLQDIGEWDGTVGTEYSPSGGAERSNKQGFTLGDTEYWFGPNASIIDRTVPASPTSQRLDDDDREGPGWTLLMPGTTTLFQ